jgi:hypothetical protein
MIQQSSIEQLIEEIKRRVQIIQSEPQTMARELMIDNLFVDLENYQEIHKEEIINANWEACEDSDRAEQYYNKTFKSE